MGKGWAWLDVRSGLIDRCARAEAWLQDTPVGDEDGDGSPEGGIGRAFSDGVTPRYGMVGRSRKIN